MNIPLLASRIREQALSILNKGVADGTFPGAAFAITFQQQLLISGSVGRFTYEQDSPKVMPQTVFDLASVTKVIATTAMAMQLYEQRKLELDQKVIEVMPEFISSNEARDARREQITFRMLLAHSSGLPAYARLFEQVETRETMLDAIYKMPLAKDPDTHTEYSDIGFILLGEALSRIAGEALHQFCRREIFVPLEMEDTTYLPPASWKPEIPPTVNDQKNRGRIIQGEVNDENASVLSGVAGHAGVFSNAENMTKFALSMLGFGPELFRPETIRLFTTRQSVPAGTSYALGWDTPSAPSQSGQHFSSNSFGHLGYTGTSLWIDNERKISVTLLTNRTWPNADNQAIKQLRPKFHDAIMQELLKFNKNHA